MLSNSNNTAPSIGTIAKRYITTGLFGLDAEGIYRMFFNTQLQALYPIVPKVIRAEMIYFFLNTNILVSLPITNDSLAKKDELEPVQRTGTCGQDPMLLPFFFFNIDFFSYKQHFATFYVSLYDIYTINTIKQ
jgi:hypothetical protein